MNDNSFSNSTKIGIIVLTVLSIVVAFSYVYSSIMYYSGLHLLIEVIPTVFLFIAVAYYALKGYKKPHGDLLRYVFLVFAIKNFVAIIADVMSLVELEVIDSSSITNALLEITLRGVSIIITAYVSGRLDKVEKNKVLLVILVLSHLANMILWDVVYFEYSSIIDFLWYSASFVFSLDLVFAYTLRYRKHKEAGLEDK